MTTKKPSERKIPFYTPIFDILISKYDIETALVFGKIFRYCRSYEICYAEQKTLAKEIGLSVSTFGKRKRLLEKDGYIIDLTMKFSGVSCKIKLTDKIYTEVTSVRETEGYVTETEGVGTAYRRVTSEKPTNNGINNSNNDIQQQNFSNEKFDDWEDEAFNYL